MKQNKLTRSGPGGFSLIELLVVVAIIALPATGAASVYPKILVDVKSKAAMRQAYAIHVALSAYAHGNDGAFPSRSPDGSEAATANEAYRQLFVKGWVDDERIFYVAGSGWHAGRQTDGDIGTPADGFGQALTENENHWGYVKGLTIDRHDTTLPLVMDGGTSGSPGVYSRDPSAPGGCWKGQKAVMVTIGGSARVHDLDPRDLRIKLPRGGRDVDVFSAEYGANPQNVLNPAGGR